MIGKTALNGIFAVAGMFLHLGDSQAESLITTLSSEKVSIESNFAGADVTVFGSIIRDVRTISRAEPYMLALKLKGPPVTMVTRQKSSILGVWINRYSSTYTGVPIYYSVNLSGPLEDISLPILLQQEQIGLENLHLAEIGSDSESKLGNDDFREAFIRIRQEHGYYSQHEDAIEMLNDNLFRTTFSLPATVPVGEYELTSYLFRGGTMLNKDVKTLTIAKSGFEQYTYEMAHSNSLLYGFVAVILAIFTGWLASIIFRKD